MLPGLSFFVCSGGRNLRRRGKPVGGGWRNLPRRPASAGNISRGRVSNSAPRNMRTHKLRIPLAKAGGRGYNKRVVQVSLLCWVGCHSYRAAGCAYTRRPAALCFQVDCTPFQRKLQGALWKRRVRRTYHRRNTAPPVYFPTWLFPALGVYCGWTSEMTRSNCSPKSGAPGRCDFRELHFRLLLSSLLLQPFANKVCNHVCREGSNQGNNEVHGMSTSSHCGGPTAASL